MRLAMLASFALCASMPTAVSLAQAAPAPSPTTASPSAAPSSAPPSSAPSPSTGGAAPAGAFHPTRFSVVDEGKGPDVILIPGLACSRDVFKQEAALLAPSYTLHLVQIAGFGGEPAGPNAKGRILAPTVEELHRYIVSSGFQHPAVIGHSIGGLIALMLADAHPEDVGKLMMVDTLPFFSVLLDPAATAEGMRPRAVGMAQATYKQSDAAFAQSEADALAGLVKSAAGRKDATAMAVASSRMVVAEALYEDLTTDMRSRLRFIKTRTTVLFPWDKDFGEEPETEAVYRSAYQSMPNVHLVEVDNSYHFIMYDQPAAFNKDVQKFLASAK